jgi:stage II sporulation protein D
MKFWFVCAFGASLLAQNYKVQTPLGVLEMTPDAYVAGVVTAESSVFKSHEAMKAIAVAARTYAARMRGRHSKEGFDFCSTTHCQRFENASASAIKASQETARQMLWFGGKPAFSVYSRSCGGKTEAVGAVWPDVDAPYLSTHADPYCASHWTWSASTDEVRRALLAAGLKVPSKLASIAIVRHTDSGRAKLLSLDGQLLSASTFRFAIGRFIGWNTVRSEQYTIENSGDRILFRGSGEGHGVGLCQMGADEMGQQGKSLREILAFYYPGTTVSANASEFHWTRLSGESIVLHTLMPDTDRVLIGTAEAIMKRWRGRLPWPAPPSIDIYVYPDLDSFRNATGEPGWVAARTNGTKIEMQPAAVLRSHNALGSTLQHELLHCYIESAAREALPVWFREGLVEHLAGRTSSQYEKASENDMRQRTDRKAAENAYLSARAHVDDLIARYGEAAVLGWVTAGLPDAVKNSTAKSPPVNNK